MARNSSGSKYGRRQLHGDSLQDRWRGIEKEDVEVEERVATSKLESSVLLVVEVAQPRGECAFPNVVKTSMTALSATTC